MGAGIIQVSSLMFYAERTYTIQQVFQDPMFKLISALTQGILISTTVLAAYCDTVGTREKCHNSQMHPPIQKRILEWRKLEVAGQEGHEQAFLCDIFFLQSDVWANVTRTDDFIV